MGIYDRDYYRNEGPSYIGAYLNTGKVCMYLVAIHVVIYIAQLVTAPPLHQRFPAGAEEAQDRRPSYGPITDYLCMKPVETFQEFQLWRLVTGMFVHYPFSHWHMIWNMLWLWWLGRDVESLYGSREFLAFYLVAGVLGNLLWGIIGLWAHVADPVVLAAMGASGAVMAVQVLCPLHYPTRIIMVCFVLPVPLWVITIVAVAGNVFFFLTPDASIAATVAAPMAGAGFATLYWYTQLRILGLWDDLISRARRSPRSRPRLRVYRDEPAVAVKRPPSEEQVDRQLARQADQVLEKISRQGKESLTEEEREILRRASEEFRKRRR